MNAGIKTSTFGIGQDYDETLLAPMAVAGGGQFHNLRHGGEIEATFAGELSELFAVAVRDVRLILDAPSGTRLDVISDYHHRRGDDGRLTIDIGDLIAGEERRLVLRCRLAGLPSGSTTELRCRLAWIVDGRHEESGDGLLTFTGAADAEADAEAPEPEVLHWTGLHHSARTKKEVATLLRDGNREAARKLIHRALAHFAAYPQTDAEVQAARAEIEGMLSMTEEDAVYDAMVVKEATYVAQTFSKGQRDFRGPRKGAAR